MSNKVNSLLTDRLRQKNSKMGTLAMVASQGNLSSFSGVFKVNPLTEKEVADLSSLLSRHSKESVAIDEDLQLLTGISSEIKAINNQAIILHGERIKKGQEILKKYQDGVFSLWLISVYGNRQTPYNFLCYYELYLKLPQVLHTKLDAIPRQVIYTLASRNAPLEEKKLFIENYNGETKTELLTLIRKKFPIDSMDGRKENFGLQATIMLQKLEPLFESEHFHPTLSQKQTIQKLLHKFLTKVINQDTLS
jgi:hypothetical protein